MVWIGDSIGSNWLDWRFCSVGSEIWLGLRFGLVGDLAGLDIKWGIMLSWRFGCVVLGLRFGWFGV